MSKRDSDDFSDEIWVNKFTEDSAQHFRKEVLKRAMENGLQPIVIYIDSYGGYVDSLAKMIETMDEVPNPFITVCMGKAVSCGAILLSHGDARYCGRHSRIMVHEVSSGAFGDVNDVKNTAKETDRLNKHFIGLLAKNCGIRGGYEGLRKIIKQHDGRNLWMDAQEAIKFGIVDKIGLPEVQGSIFYEIADVPEKNVQMSGFERSTHSSVADAPTGPTRPKTPKPPKTPKSPKPPRKRR